jgi:hypothetical protein
MNIVATSNSWGARDRWSSALSQALDHAGRAGILFVAAAGNSESCIEGAPSLLPAGGALQVGCD